MNPTMVDNDSMVDELSNETTRQVPRVPVCSQELLQIKPMAFAPIVIYLQTNDHHDDVLIIRKMSPDNYSATFYNHTVSCGTFQNIDGYDNLIQYLDSFIILQTCDKKGCEYIQIEVPGMPAIIIYPTRSHWDNIFPSISRVLKNMCTCSSAWPKHFVLGRSNTHN